MNQNSLTLKDLIMEYFKAHPNEDLSHGPVVDWVTEQWLKDHKSPPETLGEPSDNYTKMEHL